MSPKRAFESTDVPVYRSREQIDKLLRTWDCTDLQWTDRYPQPGTPGRVTLRFRWAWEGVPYTCRLDLPVPTWEQVRAEYSGRPTNEQVQGRVEQRFRTLHRLMLHKLKADLNSVQSGIVSAVEALLPYIEGGDGRTIAEVLIPRLREVNERQGVARMLEAR